MNKDRGDMPRVDKSLEGKCAGRNKGERGIVWGEIKTMENCKSGIMMGRELSDLEYKHI